MFQHYTTAGSASPEWLRLCRALESEPAAAPAPVPSPPPQPIRVPGAA